MKQILHVTPELLPNAWPYILEFLEDAPALWKARWRPMDVYPRILNTTFVCLMANDADEFVAMGLGNIIAFPLRSEFHTELLIGKDMEKWLPLMLAKTEQITAENGASVIWGGGRDGWQRYLPQFGFTAGYPCFYKEVAPLRVH